MTHDIQFKDKLQMWHDIEFKDKLQTSHNVTIEVDPKPLLVVAGCVGLGIFIYKKYGKRKR